MSYLTENVLSNTVDVPVALPATDLRMGDWMVISSVAVTEPMRLTFRVASLRIMSSSVDTSLITSGNKVYGNLGLVYLVLRRNYVSGTPGAAGGLDVLVASALGTTTRNFSSVVTATTPGVYSWVLANNMQASTDASPVIPTSTSIDFRVTVNGAARIELNSA